MDVLSFVEALMDSWAIYPVLFGLSFVDALVPVFPSEAPIIMAGVYAASTGEPIAALVVLVAAAGACLGDHLTYSIGRRFAHRVARIGTETRRGRALDVTRRLIRRRGPTALLVGRFIPWGRIAVNLLMGAGGTPLRHYTPYDVAGVLLWATYSLGLGYIGGATFEHNALAGILFGLGIAMAFTALIEGTRWLVARRRARPTVRDTADRAA